MSLSIKLFEYLGLGFEYGYQTFEYGYQTFEYLGLGLSIEYILNTQAQMLEYFEYTCLIKTYIKTKIRQKENLLHVILFSSLNLSLHKKLLCKLITIHILIK